MTAVLFSLRIDSLVQGRLPILIQHFGEEMGIHALYRSMVLSIAALLLTPVAIADATGARVSREIGERSPASSGTAPTPSLPGPTPVSPSGPQTVTPASGVNEGLAAGMGVGGGAVEGGGCGRIASCPRAELHDK